MSIYFDTQKHSQRLLSGAIKNVENVCVWVCFDLIAEKSDTV